MATGMERPEPPLIVIAGPTASGKTALAIRLAKQYNGEVICADSRTIYVGMDIGTAKPTVEEQAGVPHWGLDLAQPGQPFSAAEFKTYATQKIAEIRERGHVPILAGGTGLYIDAVIFDYQFGLVDPARREQLERMTINELHQYCFKNNIELPENAANKRHLVRRIERGGTRSERRMYPLDNSIVVGIATNKEQLRTRIALRFEQMLTNGVVREATKLGERYGWEGEAMTGNIYPLIRDYQKGELTLDDIGAKITTLDYQLAKRQMTWFRRNPFIVWGDIEGSYAYIANILSTHDVLK